MLGYGYYLLIIVAVRACISGNNTCIEHSSPSTSTSDKPNTVKHLAVDSQQPACVRFELLGVLKIVMQHSFVFDIQKFSGKIHEARETADWRMYSFEYFFLRLRQLLKFCWKLIFHIRDRNNPSRASQLCHTIPAQQSNWKIGLNVDENDVLFSLSSFPSGHFKRRANWCKIILIITTSETNADG